MALDRKQQMMMVWVDNNQHRSKVSAAKRLIYEDNLQVDCAAVEKLLKDMSLVPNTVHLDADSSL
jgi:hypothetical protein